MIRFVCGAAALALLATPVAALDVAAVKPLILTGVAADYAHLDALYKDIHQHPELGFQETRTAAKLAGEMRALGFTVTERVGKTGIVAIYKNGPGPTILVRTELDALPMEEKTGLPYASVARQTWNGRETFVDHACGHDVHMAIWVGTAKQLLSQKAHWRGALMFIGQPAEEMVAGAKAMLDDGLYTRFGKPDYAIALHVGAALAGYIDYRPGPSTSTADTLEILFAGRGAHGSMPNLSIDPVIEAAHFITDVQTVISREKDPWAFGVITVGGVQAGSAGNIIPDSALLRGTIRTYDEGARQKLFDGIRRTANAVAAMAGAPAPKITIGDTAWSIVNDEAVVARTATVLKAGLGSMTGLSPKPGTASEDFSEFLRAGVPGLQLGEGALSADVLAAAAKAGIPPPGNHNPGFAPAPEPTIKAGVLAMTLSVMNLMQPKG